MGVKLKDLVIRKEIVLSDLKGKLIAIDAYNMLYQFLSSIRQMDGSYLTDSKGQVTSHLIGLFSRMSKLLSYGIKPIMVFDGKPSELKKTILDKRKQIKEKAQEYYNEAIKEGNLKEAHKYSRQISKLTPEMVEEAKQLLDALGVPYIQAPEEGEAQAAHLCKKGIVYATASQDYDTLLFGSPKLITNLTLSNKKKSKDKLSYEKVSPEILTLQDVLKQNNITHDQLILLSILTGTDYLPKGIPGLGPKKALKVVQDFKEDFEQIKLHVKWTEHYPDTDIKVIFDMFKHPNVTDNFEISFGKPSFEKLIEVLCDKHDFSRQRVEQTCTELLDKSKENDQKSLFDF
jgi:flap endonuclease-1